MTLSDPKTSQENGIYVGGLFKTANLRSRSLQSNKKKSEIILLNIKVS